MSMALTYVEEFALVMSVTLTLPKAKRHLSAVVVFELASNERNRCAISL